MTANHGGARVRSGPPPDPNALRRDRDGSDWYRFPADRPDEPPVFPLPRPTRRERLLWAREWARGVANAWAMFDLASQVAIYVRTLAFVERNPSNASLLAKVLSMEDRLGLTPAGLARNRWILASPAGAPQPLAEHPGEEPAPPAGRAPRRRAGPSVRERLESRGMGVVDGGA